MVYLWLEMGASIVLHFAENTGTYPLGQEALGGQGFNYHAILD